MDYGAFLSKYSMSNVHVAEDHEHENKDIEEKMSGHRDRPHSRNDAGVGLPAIWNRRKRVDIEDPDTGSSNVDKDKDMSLNYKHSAKNKKTPKDKKTPRDILSRINKLGDHLGKISPAFAESFRSNDFEKLKDLAKSDPSKCLFLLSENERSVNESVTEFSDVFRHSDNLSKTITEAWNKTGSIYGRAGIVDALKRASLKIKIPESIKIPVLRSHGNKISDLTSIKAILKPGEKISNLPDEDVERFVAMATAYKLLSGNPKNVSSNQLRDEKTSKIILRQVNAVYDLTKVTSAWHDAMSKFKTDDSGNIDVSEGNWEAILAKINGFLNSPRAPIEDPNRYLFAIAEQMNEKYGEVPEEIGGVLEGYGVPLKDLDTRSYDEKTQEDRKARKQEKIDQKSYDREKERLLKIKRRDEKIVQKVMDDLAKKRQKVSENKVRDVVENHDFSKDSNKPGSFEKSFMSIMEKLVRPIEKLEQRFDRSQKKKTPEGSDPDSGEKTPGGTLSATSNKPVCHRMMNRSAAYHGIVFQGHPTDPAGSSPVTYDKRYFGKKHYDSIIASAEKYLSEDWLKYGWGDNPGDVPVRAALDLAIHTADNGLYQSRIDSMIYGMLLNRLAGWDYDTFNETLLAGPKTRKASVKAMNSSAHEILKIADSLRSTHPGLSVQIIKNVHAIMRSVVAAEPEQGQSFREEKEKELEKKLLSVLEEFGLPKGNDMSDLIDDVLKEIDKIGDSGRTSMTSPKVLRALIRVAHEKPEYRKHLKVVVSAMKKKNDKKKKPPFVKKDEKKSSAPAKKDEKDEKKSSAPEKKDKKDDKKGKKLPTSKKRKAGVVLASSDINW